MTERNDENFQRGLAEIWRREKLLIASIAFLAIFAIIAAIPASLIWGGYSHLIVLIIPAVVFVRIWFWVLNTPCPKCGHPYGGLRIQKKCAHCETALPKEKPANYKISFKEITYQPIEKAQL